MKRRIIFLDIDGTLTEPGKNIPPDSALRAIREARAAGHLVYLCSGRNFDMLFPAYAGPPQPGSVPEDISAAAGSCCMTAP